MLTSIVKMPVCKFFAKGHCARGDTCYYEHVRTSTSQHADRKAPPADAASPITGRLERPRSSRAETRARPKLPCHFYARGACKNGALCRFEHELSTALSSDSPSAQAATSVDVSRTCRFWLSRSQIQEQIPKKSLPLDDSAYRRDLGGAVVTFGPGAAVMEAITSAASAAHLQMCTVGCTWYKPSRHAFLAYNSRASAEAAMRIMSTGPNILGRKVQCRLQTPQRKGQTYSVQVGNLDIATTSALLEEHMSKRRPPLSVTLGDPSYTSSDRQIDSEVRKLCSNVGKIESWNLDKGQSRNRVRVIVKFSKMEEASRAVKELNGKALPQLNGSKIMVNHSVSAKFSIFTEMHAAVQPELIEILPRLRGDGYVNIKAYPSTSGSRFTTLRVSGEDLKAVARAKNAVEQILRGSIAMKDTTTIWDSFFLKPEGLTYLQTLGHQHDVFVYRDARQSRLALYGSAEKKNEAQEALWKKVDGLKQTTSVIVLNSGLLIRALHGGFRRIVAEFGKCAAQLNIVSGAKSITIRGSVEDAVKAKSILEDRDNVNDTNDAKGGTDTETMCSVCWCEATEPYVTPCGHTYCAECFENQCCSAGKDDIPVRCIGAAATCSRIFALTELSTALSSGGFDELLESSFALHVRGNPTEFQYCPTPDCPNIYRISMDGQVVSCSKCLTPICTTCRVVNHEGSTCEEYKDEMEGGDIAFKKWKNENKVKDCPKCGSAIEKTEG